MKVYIAGKITGATEFKRIFGEAETRLTAKGYKVMNPATLPLGFEYNDYMTICYSMIDVCDAVYFLDGWEESRGANLEHSYAKGKGKRLCYESSL